MCQKRAKTAETDTETGYSVAEIGRNGWLLTLNYATAWQKREEATKIDTETCRTVAGMGGKTTNVDTEKGYNVAETSKKVRGRGTGRR